MSNYSVYTTSPHKYTIVILLLYSRKSLFNFLSFHFQCSSLINFYDAIAAFCGQLIYLLIKINLMLNVGGKSVHTEIIMEFFPI